VFRYLIVIVDEIQKVPDLYYVTDFFKALWAGEII